MRLGQRGDPGRVDGDRGGAGGDVLVDEVVGVLLGGGGEGGGDDGSVAEVGGLGGEGLEVGADVFVDLGLAGRVEAGGCGELGGG